MSKSFSAIGIILVFIGTIFSLWSILYTKTSYMGTALQHDQQQETFKKDKKNVIIGSSLISIGSLLQIIGLFL